MKCGRDNRGAGTNAGPAMAIAVLAWLSLLAALAYAKGGDSGGASVSTESGSEASAAIAFKDVDESGSVLDWGPDSGGPEFEAEAWTRSRFVAPSLPWLGMGPQAEAEGRIDTDAVTPNGSNPYLIADSMSLRGLVGWGFDAKRALGTGDLKANTSLLAGLSLLDLNEADIDYLAIGANAENFWFRVEPCLGLDASCAYKALRFEASIRDRLFFTWDSGTAYGRDWAAGFEESLDLKASYAIAERKGFSLKAKAQCEGSLESRITAPILKGSCALRLDFDWKRLGILKLEPLAWSYRAKTPGYDLAGIDDVERQLSGEIEWEAKSSYGSWSLCLGFPWWADEDGSACPGQWKLGVTLKAGD